MENKQEEIIEIVIPESFLEFANADIHNSIEGFQDYCTDVGQDGNNILLEVTEEQKQALIDMYKVIISRVRPHNSEESGNFGRN